MSKNKKPKSKFKLFSAYWWNPFFWLAVICTPFYYFIVHGCTGFYDSIINIVSFIKNADLK